MSNYASSNPEAWDYPGSFAGTIPAPRRVSCPCVVCGLRTEQRVHGEPLCVWCQDDMNNCETREVTK